MDDEINKTLRIVAGSLSQFLHASLPKIGGSGWWETHVHRQLSYGQQGQLRTRQITSIGGLDLAALLRVMDKNWAELSYEAGLNDVSRSHGKELLR